MSDPTLTGQDEARRALADNIERLAKAPSLLIGDEFREALLALGLAVYPYSGMLAAALRAPSLDRGAEEWQPIADKPPEAGWIVYLPDGAADGLGWALDPDEKLAALIWWEATSPYLSEITHFRKPIAGPSALAQQAKGQGGGADG